MVGVEPCDPNFNPLGPIPSFAFSLSPTPQINATYRNLFLYSGFEKAGECGLSETRQTEASKSWGADVV